MMYIYDDIYMMYVYCIYMWAGSLPLNGTFPGFCGAEAARIEQALTEIQHRASRALRLKCSKTNR